MGFFTNRRVNSDYLLHQNKSKHCFGYVNNVIKERAALCPGLSDLPYAAGCDPTKIKVCSRELIEVDIIAE